MSTFAPAYQHIVVVVEENHSYSEIIGNAQAPYINSLATGGALLSNYYAVTHPSQPNYFALYAGTTFGVLDNADHAEASPTLASILQASGKTFLGYVEAGSPRKHNPWESFPEGNSVGRSFSAFPSNDFSELPNVSFVIPNLNDDMHDGTVAQADHWLQTNLDGYAQWALTHNSLLVVVWDEDDNSANNHVPAIIYGAHVNAGPYGDSYSHYDLLSTILAANHLASPNYAADASGIGNGAFQMVPGLLADIIPPPYRPSNFNGDRDNDLSFRNANGGDVAIWQLNGTQKSLDQVVSAMGRDWHLTGIGDFDGNGNSDFLWRNNTGDVAVWLMNGAQKSADVVVSKMGNDWLFEGLADVDGDGKSDILWRNTDGDAAVWEMNGTQKKLDQLVSTMGNDWHYTAAGDFNGGGKSDILWRNDSGDVAVWLMNGAQKIVDQVVSAMGNDWHFAALADFNGDGRSDILWRNNTGDVALWQMNGVNKVADQVVSAMGNDWHVYGTGDFNGDGKADILWRNDGGDVAIWTMNGALKVADQVVSHMGNDWHYLGLADFNGDGRSDILWRHNNGDVAAWLMDGTQRIADQVISHMGNDWLVA